MESTPVYDVNELPTYCPQCVSDLSPMHLQFSLNDSNQNYGRYSLVCDLSEHLIHVFPLGVAPWRDWTFDARRSAENDSQKPVSRCAFRGDCDTVEISADCRQAMCDRHCRETGGCARPGHEQPKDFDEGLNILIGAIQNNDNYPLFLRSHVPSAPRTFAPEDYTVEARERATCLARLPRLDTPSSSPSPSPPPPVHEVVVYTWTESSKPVHVERHDVLPQNPHWSRPGQRERYQTYSVFYSSWEDVPHDHVHHVAYGQPA
uniref:Uncharacterized protein n=1 Tax=Mycena chlorophos TaxID=658473 RepID=A0ABQ0KW81_MYCCL|nr:predicted protein [Mycena chlorophos]